MINLRTPSYIIRFNTVKEVIYTHSNLTEDEKKYSINFISNLEEKNEAKFHRFFLFANLKTFTGTFCGSYNDYFEEAVKSKNEKILRNMVQELKEEIFIELFDNRYLSSEEKNKVLNIMNKEFMAITNSLQTAITKNNIYSNILTGDGSIYETELKKLLNTHFEVFPGFIKDIYITDTIKNSKIPKIFQLDLFSLLLILQKQNLNPKTNEPFTLYKYEQLKNKYDLELKLIQRYLKTKK